MKKILFCLTFILLAVACKDGKNGVKGTSGERVLYEGYMPAAVGKGISCSLELNAEVVGNDTTFIFIQTLLAGGPEKQDITHLTKGTQHYISNMHEGVAQKYLKLVPNDGTIEVLFRVVGDSLLRMVREDFSEYSDNKYYNFRRVF